VGEGELEEMYYVLCIIGDLKGKEYKEIPPLKGGRGM
jgi:hypothetical protein